jgi:hypothetical protein
MAIYLVFYTKWHGGRYLQLISETPLTTSFAARTNGGVPPPSIEAVSASPQINGGGPNGLVDARARKGRTTAIGDAASNRVIWSRAINTAACRQGLPPDRLDREPAPVEIGSHRRPLLGLPTMRRIGGLECEM